MFPKTFQKLIDHFSSLPSVGPKMAERLVLYLFKRDPEKIKQFARDLHDFATNVHYCKECYNISENKGECGICKSKKRDRSTVCVVEEPLDVIAFEKTRRYLGLYHVLGGVISPINGIGPDELKISALVNRIKTTNTSEIIMAISPTIEGDTTIFYIWSIDSF